MRKAILSVFAVVGMMAVSNAQVVNSTQISIGSDAIISTDMDFLNATNGKLDNEGTLMLQRNVTNDGAISSKGKLVLNGNSAQKLAGKKAIDVANIEFNNGGTTLNTPVRVTENAQFNKGIVQADETFPVTFAENARVTNASDISHVDGFVRIEKAKEFTFPIGDGSQLKSFSVEKADNFTASYKNVSPMYISQDRSEAVENMNENEYWILKSNGRSVSTKVSVEGNVDSEAIVALNKGTWDVADLAATKTGDRLNSNMPLTSTEQLFTVGKGRKNQASVGIYPNPTRGDFHLTFKGIDDSESVKVSITLANGTSILSMEGKAGDLKKQYTMPENLSSQGLLLRVSRVQKSQNFVERIVFDK
jgi:hypothetical protein